MKSETCPECEVKKDESKIFNHLKEEHDYNEDDFQMYAVFTCQECSQDIEDPPSIPATCKCGSEEFKLNLDKSTGLPDEMIEKAKPQVTREIHETEDIQDMKKADSRGRINLGRDYANKKVKIAVLETKEEK